MTRVRSLLAVAIPSMLVGGLVFRNSFGHAAAGTEESLGYWPASSGGVVVADNRRPPRDRWATPPSPPTEPTPPTPPTPPHHGRVGGGKVSVSIHGDQIRIDGIDEVVTEHLEAVRGLLRNNANIPKDVRDKIVARMDRVKNIVDRRMKNLNFKATDIDKLEQAMDRMGEELEQALEGLDQDLAQLGDKLAKDLAKQMGKDFLKNFSKQKFKFNFDGEDNKDNKDDQDDSEAAEVDDSDNENSAESSDEPAIEDLRGMTLKPAQRDAIQRLRATSDAQVASVQKQLDDASHRLETALADPKTSDADVVRLVDQVSGHEAAIRKAKLLAWVQARRVLDADQVKKIESAQRKNHR